MDIVEISIVDSHTGGEPTRVVTAGGPDLGAGSLLDRRELFAGQFDWFRKAILSEPRGTDIMVGALLCEPDDPDCDFGVIFFNNVGYIGMCGHGTIGLVKTLGELGKIGTGVVRIDTPVGPVSANCHPDGSVSVTNVNSYRYRADVELDVPGLGLVRGDIAWGGNWFFLVKNCPLDIVPKNIGRLTSYTQSIRNHLDENRILGRNDGHIDHIEVYGRPLNDLADSKNFVLCPGGQFDRSPCGTGTSAKAACLYADGALQPGQIYRQESIVGSIFEVTVEADDLGVIPTIRGNAYIHMTGTMILDPQDPFRFGIDYE